ncbi:hypothetical protein C8Q69DRAFT_312507 [Paecilomyces variotii]|uniref:Helicase C-terminal domain-containing protein n=1 Tax=Byssochlamys spectabilis TaxID=264951 RepID=A0A443HQC9_BYSSP|nr:hypothetical protein C8Q69DRAFT_312507 [Paecilomyces variotii]RWQ94007.1 hypothetical protein C8Q69DRAFT_312507 [Paecilomyces variotii]
MVLICSYYVNSAGSNLQSLCRNVHLFDIPTSDRFVQQAIGRVRRLRQRRIMKVYDYFLENSFKTRQLTLNLNKLEHRWYAVILPSFGVYKFLSLLLESAPRI